MRSSISVRADADARQLILPARWCNGSTTGSDSVCLGSSPSRATIRYVKKIDGARM